MIKYGVLFIILFLCAGSILYHNDYFVASRVCAYGMFASTVIAFIGVCYDALKMMED